MSRMLSRAERLRAIERLLYNSPDGLSAIEIAQTCHVGRRTVYRDLELLESGGVPLWQDGGRFGIIRERYLTTVRVNFNEAVALFLAVRLLGRHADAHNPHVVSALSKLATALPEPLASRVARLAGQMRKRPVDSRYVAVIEAVTLAWASQRKVRLWYRSPRTGELHPRDVSPYTVEVLPTSRGTYVVGYDEWAKALRTFRLERLERAQMLEETYTVPKDFDPEQHFARAWGIMTGDEIVEVVLQFTPAVAALVKEHRWHPSQSLDDLADGGVLLVVRIGDPREMRPWIRSWGAECEVLEPDWLRAELREETERMAARYRMKG
jgi:predicted DNA-binding transcriptional regulator YafY